MLSLQTFVTGVSVSIGLRSINVVMIKGNKLCLEEMLNEKQTTVKKQIKKSEFFHDKIHNFCILKARFGSETIKSDDQRLFN